MLIVKVSFVIFLLFIIGLYRLIERSSYCVVNIKWLKSIAKRNIYMFWTTVYEPSIS